MLVAAAAMAFVSCQKEQGPSQLELSTLTFSSENPVSKTHWDGQTIIWSDDDAIRVALMIGDTWYNDNNGAKLYQSKKLSQDAQTAKFAVSDFTQDKITAGGWTGAYQFYGLSPASAEDANFGKTTSKASIEIPATQVLSSDTFDKSADILWGKAVNTYSELPSSDVSMVWSRVVAHAYISLNDINGITAGELVKSVTLTAQDGAALTGEYELHMATGEFTAKSSVSNKVVLSSSEGVAVSGNDLTLWACINPCNVTSLNIVVDTDKAVYSIDKTNLDLDFLVNRRNVQPVNMSRAERVEKGVSSTYYVKVTEEPSDWSGQYLIVCEEANMAMTGSATDAAGIKKPTEVEITQNGIQHNSTMEAISVTISPVTAGYLIVTHSGYGVYCTDNNTTFSASSKSSTYSKYPYTIGLLNGKFDIIRGGKYMMYNKSTNGFGFYTSETQTAVQLYRLED